MNACDVVDDGREGLHSEAEAAAPRLPRLVAELRRSVDRLACGTTLVAKIPERELHGSGATLQHLFISGEIDLLNASVRLARENQHTHCANVEHIYGSAFVPYRQHLSGGRKLDTRHDFCSLLQYRLEFSRLGVDTQYTAVRQACHKTLSVRKIRQRGAWVGKPHKNNGRDLLAIPRAQGLVVANGGEFLQAGVSADLTQASICMTLNKDLGFWGHVNVLWMAIEFEEVDFVGLHSDHQSPYLILLLIFSKHHYALNRR